MRRTSLTSSERSARLAVGAPAGATTVLAVLLLLALTPGPAAMACVGVERTVASFAQRTVSSLQAQRVRTPAPTDLAAATDRDPCEPSHDAPALAPETAARAGLMDLPPPTR